MIATYALGCFRNFSCTPVPKLPWRAPTPVRLVKEWILMLLKKTINLKTVYILISDVFFFIKKCHNIFGPPLCHLGQWLMFYWPRKKISGQPKAGSHFRHWSCSSVNFFFLQIYSDCANIWLILIIKRVHSKIFHPETIDLNDSILDLIGLLLLMPRLKLCPTYNLVLNPRWPQLLKIKISLIDHYCYTLCQNEIRFNLQLNEIK